MNLVFYCCAVTLMLRRVWRLGDIFGKKGNVLESSSPEPVTLIGSALINVPEQLAKL